MAESNFTLHWNEKAEQFFAKYRLFPPPEFGSDQPEWGTKRVPKGFRRHQRLDAERWMIGWYTGYVGSGGVNVSNPKVVAAKKTLRLLGPRWLDYRYDDRGTKINTYKGLKESLHNWIFDNERFDHLSIERLEMERDFAAEVCLRWIDSIKGADSSVLNHATSLSTIFDDCIALGWLDPDLQNPMKRPIVLKRLAKLRETAKQEKIITHLTALQAEALLTMPTRKVIDFRRVRYLLVLATGLRDHEVQGLIWSDLHLDDALPYVFVDRQLDKIGCQPFLYADKLAREGKEKDDILAMPNALVSPPKKNSRRAIPLLPIAVAVLRWWRSTGWKLYVGFAPKKDDPVFPSGNANRHSPPGQFAFVESPELLRKDLERVGEPTTFDGVEHTFHGLRRTFATLLNENGVSELEVGDLLGHGAKSVARGHYIAPELLGRKLKFLRHLPLPNRVQLQAKVIEVARDEVGRSAEVIDLRTRRSR